MGEQQYQLLLLLLLRLIERTILLVKIRWYSRLASLHGLEEFQLWVWNRRRVSIPPEIIATPLA